MLGNPVQFLSYQAGHSVLHRLDPRTKLLGAVLVVADVLAASVPWGMLIAYVFGVTLGVVAHSMLSRLWRVLRPLPVLIALFGVLIVITTPGKPLTHFHLLITIVPTRDGLDLAIRLALQVLLIVYTTSLLTLTTPALAIADALFWATGWLERFRVPVRDIVAMVAIGLTFVPLLLEEVQKVIAAQRARGADLSINALLEDESMGALLIPLLLANLRRGAELAESMEARLYNTGPRTSLIQRRFHRIDLTAALVVLGFSAALIVISFRLY